MATKKKGPSKGEERFLHLLEEYRDCEELRNEFLRLMQQEYIKSLSDVDVNRIFEEAKEAAREILSKRGDRPVDRFTLSELTEKRIHCGGYRSEMKLFPADSPVDAVKAEFQKKWISPKLIDWVNYYECPMIDATELIHELEHRYEILMYPDSHHIDYFYYNKRTKAIEISEYQYAFIEPSTIKYIIEEADLPIFFIPKFSIYFAGFPEKLGYDFRLKNLAVTAR